MIRSGMAGGKITLREAQTIAYLLEHGRLPDPETAAWFETRASRPALEFLLAARLRGTMAGHAPAQVQAHPERRRLLSSE
jgi:hypothetical protein